MGEILGYAPPAKRIEWRYVRLSLLVLLIVFGWFCFSVYVWHLFGDGWGGYMPSLRRARGLMLPKVCVAVYAITAINLTYLLRQVFMSKRRTALWLVYLSLALIPVVCMWVNEIRFGHFVVE